MRKRLAGSLQWVLPGLGIKRWLVVAAFGIALLLDAVTRWFTAEGSAIHLNEIMDAIVADYFPPAYLTAILGIAGFGLAGLGLRLWVRSAVRISRTQRPH
ncbi:MAG TPA: hypothetical protein VNF49_07945, partial [Candidatus Binataceae bacterium]|nr:hypothetical protein [Candidatus Binataceae bacterium]